MAKTVFSLGQLRIEFIDDGMGEKAGGVTPVYLQENLNSMIIYINQILDRLTRNRKSCIFKKWSISKQNICISKKWNTANVTNMRGKMRMINC